MKVCTHNSSSTCSTHLKEQLEAEVRVPTGRERAHDFVHELKDFAAAVLERGWREWWRDGCGRGHCGCCGAFFSLCASSFFPGGWRGRHWRGRGSCFNFAFAHQLQGCEKHTGGGARKKREKCVWEAANGHGRHSRGFKKVKRREREKKRGVVFTRKERRQAAVCGRKDAEEEMR